MADDVTGALAAVVAIVTLPLGVLSLFFVGWEAAIVVFVVGWFLLTPLIPVVGEELLPALRDSEPDGESADPLAELRRRYAQGELGDEEFERKVGNLVETEDGAVDGGADLDRAPELDFDRK